MTVRATAEALAPAILAGVGGVAGDFIWGHPSMVIAAAVLGAAAGAVIFGVDPPSAAPAVEAEPETAVPAPASVPLAPVMDVLPGAVFVVGDDRIIQHANPEAVNIFGLPGPRGMPVAMLRSRRLLDRVGQALDHGVASTLDFSISRAGQLHLLAHVHPLEGGSRVVVAIEDRTLAQRASDSHRDFVANASHELKTPLAAVSGIIETLLGHAREDPEATERFLELLAGQTDRMTRLIEDLLSLNRVELNERVEPDEPQELVGLLSEVVDALRPIAEVSGVELGFERPTERIMGRADRDEISQLFRNLIDNAIKYGGGGTKVAVTMRTGTGENAGMVCVAVRDEGPGIAREHLPRLTERFYRVNVKRSREKGGTGLGLAICKHIANRHRGRLEIQSKLGEGSIFIVWLPVADPAQAAESPRENSVRLA